MVLWLKGAYPIMRLKAFLLGALLLTVCLVFPAAALAAAYPDGQALFEAWERDGYPDDVGGVYMSEPDPNGVQQLCILLVAPTEARTAELRALLDAPDSVQFVACAYSYNELCAIQTALSARMADKSLAINGCGVGWSGETGFGESGKEFRVVVSANAADADAVKAELSSLYGDKVYVEIGEAAQTTTLMDDAATDGIAEKEDTASTDPYLRSLAYLIPIGVVLIATLVFAIIRLKKRSHT